MFKLLNELFGRDPYAGVLKTPLAPIVQSTSQRTMPAPPRVQPRRKNAWEEFKFSTDPVPMTEDQRAELSDLHRRWIDQNGARCRYVERIDTYGVQWTRPGAEREQLRFGASYAEAVQKAIEWPTDDPILVPRPSSYDPRTPALLALANRVARLNAPAGEIGAGMLAQLVDEAIRALANDKQ